MGLKPAGCVLLGVLASTLIFGSCAITAAQQRTEPPPEPFHLKLDVSRVLVPVVVRDAQGNSVTGLKQEDFKVFDNGKPREVSGFTVEKRAPMPNGANPQIQQSPARLQPAPPTTLAPTDNPHSVILPARITVFLFDDMHMSAEDLAHARQAAVKVLDSTLTQTDMAAVVSMSGRVNTGLVRDRAKLQAALSSLVPVGLLRRDTADCPNIDYYEADLIVNKHDPIAIEDATRKVLNCNPGINAQTDLDVAQRQADSASMRVLNLARQDVLTTYASIATFVSRMALLPGQRTLILVSPGFLNVEREALDAESRIIDLAAQSNVTINALDSRGLYTTEITASQRSPALGGRSLQVNSAYNSTAQTLAENALAELADGTGGEFFHNSNDLDAGLRELTEALQCIYVLELPLDGVKRNGSYHRLQVKLDRSDVRLQARRGYFIPKPEKEKK